MDAKNAMDEKNVSDAAASDAPSVLECLYYNLCGEENLESIVALQEHLSEFHSWSSEAFPIYWPTETNVEVWKPKKFRKLGIIGDSMMLGVVEWLKADFGRPRPESARRSSYG